MNPLFVSLCIPYFNEKDQIDYLVNDIINLIEKNISEWSLNNKELFEKVIEEKYGIALENNPKKNKELEEIYKKISKKIDESKLIELYNILRVEEINFNNVKYKKLFDKLQQQYNLLSESDNGKYNTIKSFINNTISINKNNISKVKTGSQLPPQKEKSLGQRVKNIFLSPFRNS